MVDKEIDHRLEMAKQSNEAAIKYSEKAVLYLFYLNGGAATALFARAEESFYPAAVSFAWGAFLAVMCIGISYLYQMIITASWYASPRSKSFQISPVAQFKISFKTIEIIRLFPISCWICSAIFFVFGITKL